MVASNDDLPPDSASRTFSVDSVAEMLHIDVTKDPTASERNADLFSSFANMTNTICGAGILGLPYAFAHTGWIVGVFFICIGMYFSIVALQLLTYCAAKTGFPSSIYTLVHPVHKHAPIVVDCIIFIQLFGACIAYLVVIGDLMPQACTQMGGQGLWITREFWVIIGFAVAVPFSIPHNINFLKYSSGLACFFLIFVTFVVFLYALPSSSTGLYACEDQKLTDDTLPCKGQHLTDKGLNAVDALKVLSIFVFGYCCQNTTFPVVNEIVDITEQRLFFVWSSSVSASSVMYLVVAVCGYYTYGDSIKSDLLLNYPGTGLITTARVMISLVVALSYPLQINPARRSFMSIMKALYDKDDIDDAPVRVLQIRYYGFTLLFLIATLAIGLSVTDLGVVISVIGATGGNTIMFIAPGFLYLYHFADDSTPYQPLSRILDNKNTEEDGMANLDISINGIPTAGGEILSEKLLPSNHRQGGTAANGLTFDLPIPAPSYNMKVLAFIQLTTGIVLIPLTLTMIFIGGAEGG